MGNMSIVSALSCLNED